MEAIRPEDIVGAAEIAELLSITSASTVHQWLRRHPDFPRPVRSLLSGMVWDWSEVRKWAIATGRLSE